MQPESNRIDQYRRALADAIRRPMGVIPGSAVGLVTPDDLDAAEARRPGVTESIKHPPQNWHVIDSLAAVVPPQLYGQKHV